MAIFSILEVRPTRGAVLVQSALTQNENYIVVVVYMNSARLVGSAAQLKVETHSPAQLSKPDRSCTARPSSSTFIVSRL